METNDWNQLGLQMCWQKPNKEDEKFVAAEISVRDRVLSLGVRMQHSQKNVRDMLCEAVEVNQCFFNEEKKSCDQT